MTPNFFENASDEEIEEALDKADYDFYKDVDSPDFLIPIGLE